MTNITLRRAPWRAPLAPLFDRDPILGTNVRRMLDTMFEPNLNFESVGMMPAVEIVETKEEFICSTELPGLKDKDIQVTFEEGALTIKGEKHEEREEKDENRFHLCERTYGAFERSFTFAGKVDADKVSAEFKNGVLTVHLPKMTDGNGKARKVEISTK
jgi:HSP20 family molecular chaperone IbpA